MAKAKGTLDALLKQHDDKMRQKATAHEKTHGKETTSVNKTTENDNRVVEDKHSHGKTKQKRIEAQLADLNSLMSNPKHVSLFLMKDTLVSLHGANFPLWHKVFPRLEELSFSKIRNQGPPFLSYAILHAATDELIPLMRGLYLKLHLLEKLLHVQLQHFERKRFSRMKHQLLYMENIVKPVTDAISRVMRANEYATVCASSIVDYTVVLVETGADVPDDWVTRVHETSFCPKK